MKLIDQDTKLWNSPLTKKIFQEEEARVICQIPLSPVQVKDSLIWRGTLNREFSARSAYYTKKGLQALQQSGSSRQSAGTTIWKTIWNLKISNASKMSIWKACNDLLPTKMNLLKHGVVLMPYAQYAKEMTKW
jgi:hypothetical protein